MRDGGGALSHTLWRDQVGCTVIVVRTVVAARAWTAGLRRTGARLGLVPTMGALHRAHQALVVACRQHADAVVMSVFVNPTQFGPGEDYAVYPRDLARDTQMAEEAGVDLLFAPPDAELYPDGPAAWLAPGPVSKVFEGATRPGHFDGVATVVVKLLNALTPDVIMFGQKDAQQVVVVRELVRNLLLPTDVRSMPTVRAEDGLALSSRNRYLAADERRAAPVLARALQRALAALRDGERSGQGLEALLRAAVAAEPLARLDYAAVVDASTLQPLPQVGGHTLLLLAAWVGSTRLLDNACVWVGPNRVTPALP